MAGDWLKVERSTPDKEEVWALAGALDLDPDAAFGKLFRVWSWFDEHTENGNAATVTKKLLDRLVGVTGFCDAMALAGWMLEEGGVITLPNFDRHNGKTAKTRAVTNRRVAKSRKGNDKCNDGSVTKSEQKPLPEKRREEKRRKIKNKYSSDDIELASRMLEQIKIEFPSTNARPEDWAEGIRKLREIDKHDHREIFGLWVWCRNNQFWKKNVRSPLKFRERDNQGTIFWDRFSAEKNSGQGNVIPSQKSTFEHLTDRSWADDLIDPSLSNESEMEGLECQ